MIGEGAGDIQDDLQIEGAPEEAAAVAAKAVQKDIHTAMPGIIDEYQPGAQTVTVRPAIRRIFISQGSVALPPCLDVPVFFPSGGELVQTWPIKKGDECLLVVSERAIDSWFDKGDVQDPSEYRLHDLSDCFAFVGFSSKPRFLPAVNEEAMEIRTRDGELRFRIDKTTIYAGVKNFQPAVVGTNLKEKVLAKLCQALAKHTHPTGMGPSGPPTNASDFSDIESILDEILSSTVVIQKEP